MKKQHLLKTTAVLFSAAALLTWGGVAAEAASEETPVPLTAAAVQDTADTDYTYYTAPLDGDDGYDIVTLDTSSSSSKKKSPNWLKIILISLGASVLITGVVVIIIYRSYKYNGMTEPYEFKNKAPLDLREKEDVLIDVKVTSHHINRNNN